MINEYGKFVDSTTSSESKYTGDLVMRLTALQTSHKDIAWSRLMTSAIGMLAESGEFAEIIKKILFQGRSMSSNERYHMKRELGDVLWYWIQGCIALGYEPEEVMKENIAKLEKRYPNGFEIVRSEIREQGDI